MGQSVCGSNSYIQSGSLLLLLLLADATNIPGQNFRFSTALTRLTTSRGAQFFRPCFFAASIAMQAWPQIRRLADSLN